MPLNLPETEEQNPMLLSDVKILQSSRNNSYNAQMLQLPSDTCIDVAFENLSYTVPVSTFSRDKKKILKGVSGEFRSGELTAIMGPSGAGKSTLLNAISGFMKEGVTGNVFTNRLLVDRNKDQIKQNSSYIMQDDFFNAYFSVEESMMQAANIKLGTTSNYKSKSLLVENILESMSLTETKNTRCNKLSGGERKRLNICLELVDNPPILFLDEPTSKLDSSSCSMLVGQMKGLAKAGRTVICTIHQPSAALLATFDHLYLLSAGECIYQGDASNLVPFLHYVGLPCPVFNNPADYVMDIASGEFGCHNDKLIAATRSRKWRSSSDTKPSNGSQILTSKISKNEIRRKLGPKEWEKFIFLVGKFFLQQHRDWTVMYLKLLVHAIIGVIIGLLFTDCGKTGAKVFSNLSFFNTCLVYISFTTLMPAALKFPSEIKILKKEHFNNWYKFKTYYLAMVFVQIPLQCGMTLVYVSICYLLSGQLVEISRFVLFLSANMIVAIISMLIGLAAGTFGAVNGVFNGSICIAVMLLHGGFLAYLKDFPSSLYFISFFSFFRYAFEIITIGIYGLNRGKLDCPPSTLYCHIRYPQVLIEELHFDEGNLARDYIIMTVYTSIICMLTYLRLRQSIKNFH